MKTLRIFFSFVVLSVVTTSLSAQPLTAADSTQIRNEFQQQANLWMQAYNSKDARNLVPLYSEDAIYISSHVSGLVADGRDALVAYFQNGMDMGGHLDFIEIVSMNLSCDLATLLCRYQATNSGQTVEGRNILVLKRINHVWLINLHMTVV